MPIEIHDDSPSTTAGVSIERPVSAVVFSLFVICREEAYCLRSVITRNTIQYYHTTYVCVAYYAGLQRQLIIPRHDILSGVKYIHILFNIFLVVCRVVLARLECVIVVDCHQDWCGPCETLLPTFQRISLETADSDNRCLFLEVTLSGGRRGGVYSRFRME